MLKASKNPAEALEFGIGQWLWFHGKPLFSGNADCATYATGNARD
jgi:hypothetical protein